MKAQTLIIAPLVVTLSSCCLKNMDIQPTAEFEHSAKAFEPRAVGVGFRFEFNEWCPDKAYKEQLKKLTLESEEDRQRYRKGEITLARYNELQEVNKKAAIDFITQAQMSAIPKRATAAPTTTVIPLLADGKEGKASETVNKETSQKQQKESLEKAVEKVEEAAKKEQ